MNKVAYLASYLGSKFFALPVFADFYTLVIEVLGFPEPLAAEVAANSWRGLNPDQVIIPVRAFHLGSVHLGLEFGQSLVIFFRDQILFQRGLGPGLRWLAQQAVGGTRTRNLGRFGCGVAQASSPP